MGCRFNYTLLQEFQIFFPAETKDNTGNGYLKQRRKASKYKLRKHSINEGLYK